MGAVTTLSREDKRWSMLAGRGRDDESGETGGIDLQINTDDKVAELVAALGWRWCSSRKQKGKIVFNMCFSLQFL